MKTLAVIMPRYAQDQETDDITNRSIQALLDNRDKRFNTTITVVDDESRIKFSERPEVRLIQHATNRGIAVGWNTGWNANRDADFLCWINADCEVTPGWDFPLVVAAEQFDCIAMPYTNGKKAWKTGIVGWCFVARKEIAEKIGPFDETFVPAQYEDTDWFHRAIYSHKIALLNVPQSNVLHNRKHGGTQHVERFDLLHMANRYRYSWKHGVPVDAPPPFYRQPLPEVDIEDVSPEIRDF